MVERYWTAFKKLYNSEPNGKHLANDGEKTLFTIGSLAQNKLEFTVVLEDATSSRLKCVNVFFSVIYDCDI